MTSTDKEHDRRRSIFPDDNEEEEDIKGNCFTRFLYRIFVFPWLYLFDLILVAILVHQLTKTDSDMAYRTRNSSSTLGCAAFIVMIASLFFWLSAFSTPFIKSIYYLESRTNDVRFGNFGWCYNTDVNCVQRVGYHWRPEIPSGRGPTGAHILVALTAAFGTLAFFALLHSAMNLRSGAASFFLVMFTNLLAFISFLIVVITWGTAKRRFNDDTGVGGDAHYGAALPLVIVGWLLFLLAIPLVFIGWFKNRGYRNDAPVTHTTTTTTTTKPRRKFF